MMRRLSLYWKTWMITAVTIVITALLFFTVLMQFTKTFLDIAQENKFEKMGTEVIDDIKTMGVEHSSAVAALDNHSMNGLSIFIFEENKLVYPNMGSDMKVTITEDNMVIGEFTELPNLEQEDYGFDIETWSEEEIEEWFMPIELTASEYGMLDHREEVMHGGKKYDVLITYPISMSDEDIKMVFNAIIPYFIVIGLLVASAAAAVYAKYFSKKITNLNNIIKKMAKREYPLLIDKDGMVSLPTEKGDELQELENNLNSMYFELHETLESLNQEINIVKRLEEDRELFMRGAVHELKTPIMSMSTAINAKLEDVADDDEREEYLQESYVKLQSMTRLVNEILDISKLESIHSVGVTNINKAMHGTIDVYNYMLKDKGIHLTFDEQAVVDIKIPSRNLKKILSNLLGNAAKYVTEQGVILIEVTETHLKIENDMNQGIPIDINKIFQPFTTFENDCENDYEKGHGLGLYIVDAILAHYDYKYQCDIQENTFTFILYF